MSSSTSSSKSSNIKDIEYNGMTYSIDFDDDYKDKDGNQIWIVFNDNNKKKLNDNSYQNQDLILDVIKNGGEDREGVVEMSIKDIIFPMSKLKGDMLKFKYDKMFYTLNYNENYYDTENNVINILPKSKEIFKDKSYHNNDLLLDVIKNGEEMKMNIKDITFPEDREKELKVFVLYEGKKIFFNEPEQTLMNSNEKVKVIEYIPDNKVLAESLTTNEKKEYDPFKEFRGWKNYCQNQCRRQNYKSYPYVTIDHDGEKINVIYYPVNQKTSIIQTGELGQIIGNTEDHLKFEFQTKDNQIKFVDLDELSSGNSIKEKAINNHKRKGLNNRHETSLSNSTSNNTMNYSNTIQLEGQTSSSTSKTVTNTSNVSYSSVLTSGKNQDLERNSDKVTMSREDLDKLLQLKEEATKIKLKYNL